MEEVWSVQSLIYHHTPQHPIWVVRLLWGSNLPASHTHTHTPPHTHHTHTLPPTTTQKVVGLANFDLTHYREVGGCGGVWCGGCRGAGVWHDLDGNHTKFCKKIKRFQLQFFILLQSDFGPPTGPSHHHDHLETIDERSNQTASGDCSMCI